MSAEPEYEYRVMARYRFRPDGWFVTHRASGGIFRTFAEAERERARQVQVYRDALDALDFETWVERRPVQASWEKVADVQ